MLIDRYDLEVATPPCAPGKERFNAIARLMVDIADVMPFLNATWRGAIYDHQAHILTWMMGGRRIALYPYEIAISNLQDRGEAEEVVARLVKLVNRTWERRGQIQPDYTKRRRLTPLEIYKLLPGTNCKQCGEPTCFVFAAKLVAGQAKLEQCAPLFSGQFGERKGQLLAMLELAPYPDQGT